MRSSLALPCRSACAHARSKFWPLPMLALAALAALALLAAAGPVRGQTETATPRPDPLDARAAVPPVAHVSPLAVYRRAGELSVGSWREANDTVTRIGGWRTYAREAAAPAASAPAGRTTP